MTEIRLRRYHRAPQPRHLLPLLRPYDPDHLTCHPVGPMVGNPANDGPDLIAPIQDKAPVATGPTQLALLS